MARITKELSITFFFFLCVLFSCTFEKGEISKSRVLPVNLCDSLNVTYSSIVFPIIQTNCNGCHSSGYSAGDFTTYSGLKIRIDNGSFKNRVFTLKNMPTAGPLSPEILEKIQCWLDAGAPDN